MRWTILLYHNVSWEDSPFTRGIKGITCPPDLFREQIEFLKRKGEILSIPEAIQRLKQGGRGRIFSIWFDDGFKGVRQYAFPILEKNGIKAAISVCSRFTERREIYWRFKLSYLRFSDGLKFLRRSLRSLGYERNMLLKDFTLDNFSPDVIRSIDEAFNKVAGEDVLEAGFKLFDSLEGIRELKSAGWIIGNHSASHWPVGEESALKYFEEQFDEGEEFLKRVFKEEPRFVVLPFDRGTKRSAKLLETFENWSKKKGKERYLVLIGNKANTNDDSFRDKLLYRVTAPVGDGKALRKVLRFL